MTDTDQLLARIGEIAGQTRFAANAEGYAELIVNGTSVYFFTGRNDALEASVELAANVARDPEEALRLLQMNDSATGSARLAAEPDSGRVFLCAPITSTDDGGLAAQVEELVAEARAIA
ncbi:type III secretion system chaperone [Marivita sp. S0852]|uniref:type III secretion system chaperone n=1 Tax=Marivita sp. S0852 TaxID=3373893 RepID=UPI00398260AE